MAEEPPSKPGQKFKSHREDVREEQGVVLMGDGGDFERGSFWSKEWVIW